MPRIRIGRPLPEPHPAIASSRDKGDRLWIVVVYGYDAAQGEAFLRRLVQDEGARWSIGQMETCPETGRVHLQGSVYFTHQRNLASVKRIHQTAHWEIAKADVHAQVTYCTKARTRLAGPWEFGTRPAQGTRSDLRVIADAIVTREATTERQIALLNPSAFVRYHRGLMALSRAVEPVRAFQTQCFYLEGPAGVGKTLGLENLGIMYDVFEPTYEVVSRTYNWYGYTGQPIVVFDEVSARNIPRNMWLQLANRHEYRVPVKGEPPAQFRSLFVFCISNEAPPEELLQDDAWFRRWRYSVVTTREETSAWWSARRADLRSGGVVLPATSEAPPVSDDVVEVVDFPTPPKLVRQEAIVINDQSELPPSESA